MDDNEIEIFLSIAAVFQVSYQVNGDSNNFILPSVAKLSSTQCSQTLAALGRSTGPLIGIPLFAWSERNVMIYLCQSAK